MSPVAAGTGLVALDILLDDDRTSGPMWAGGSCGNVMIILSSLGWNSYPIARLDQDRVAEKIRLDMERWGVNTEFVNSSPNGRSPIVIQRIYNEKKNVPQHAFKFHCPVCGSRLPRFRRPLLKKNPEVTSSLSDVDVFYFDRAVPAAIDLAEKYKSNGAIVMFEPNNSTDQKTFSEALSVAHILKYSQEVKGNIGMIRDEMEPPLHIETLGEGGLKFKLRDESWERREPPQVEELYDTAGAGDWCSAGILNVLSKTEDNVLERSSVERGLQFGQRLAAMNCRFEGARGILYQKKTIQLMDEVNEEFEPVGETVFGENTEVFDSNLMPEDASPLIGEIQELCNYCRQQNNAEKTDT
jgi:fructokinase